MASSESLKGYLLELAAQGEQFKEIDRLRMRCCLQHRTCREIRLALNSLAFNPAFKPVEMDGEVVPPLKRKVLKRDDDGGALVTAYVPRLQPATAGVRPTQSSPYFVAS